MICYACGIHEHLLLMKLPSHSEPLIITLLFKNKHRTQVQIQDKPPELKLKQICTEPHP